MADRRNRRLQMDFPSVPVPAPDLSLIAPTSGVLTLPDGSTHQFSAVDLDLKETIGTGSYGGVVHRAVHVKTGQIMAVKRVRANEIDNMVRQNMQRELDIIIGTQKCEDVVKFFGAIFQDGDCWICMEIMDCSLDKFYRNVYAEGQRIEENVVGFIAASVVRALNYLKVEHNIIHRDVKPSNILLNVKGYVKLCDFGISGYLSDSIAKTQDVGCQIYMAPERLSERKYGIKSDVWSLGISFVEICIGKFPYPNWKSVFDQLQAVVVGDPPILESGPYSCDLVNFVNRCLIKDKNIRPTFAMLMEDPFIKKYDIKDETAMQEWRTSVGSYIAKFIESPSPTLRSNQ